MPDIGLGSAALGAAGSIFGGNNDSTIEQTSEPWGPAQGPLKDLLGMGRSAYDAGYQNTPFQTFAPMNPYQTQGLQQNLNYSQGLMPNQVGMAQGAWGSALNAPDVANNPYVMNQVMAQGDLLNRNLSENLLPQIQSGATNAGQSGSSRQGVAEGIATRGTQEAIGRQAAQTMGNAYGQGLGARSNALGMSGNVLGLGMLPGQIMQQTGGQLNAEAQRYINEAMQRQQFGQDVPWDQVARYQNVVQPIAGMGNTSTAPNPYQQNKFAAGIGGAMMGYDVGNTLFGGGGSNAGSLLYGNNPAFDAANLSANRSYGWNSPVG